MYGILKKTLLLAALLVPRLLSWAAEPSCAAPVSLFPDSVTGAAYRFIESYVAEAAAGIPADRTLEEKLFQDEVIVEGGSILELPARVAAVGPLTAPDGSPLTVSVATRLGKHYRVEWRDTLGNQVFALAFPIDHLLLTRQTPALRETRLLSALRSLNSPRLSQTSHLSQISQHSQPLEQGARGVSRAKNQPPSKGLNPKPSTLTPSSPVIVPGDCLFSPDINNHLYLSPLDSLPLVSPALYPVETLSNLITTAEIPNDLTVDLSYISLDREKIIIPVPLNPLLRYFRDEGCTLYFGFSEARPDGRHTCLLMAANPAEGYCHSLRLRLSRETIDSLSGPVDGRLTAYVPLSRILSLFDENAQ